jgi:hypothetical protein
MSNFFVVDFLQKDRCLSDKAKGNMIESDLKFRATLKHALKISPCSFPEKRSAASKYFAIFSH